MKKSRCKLAWKGRNPLAITRMKQAMLSIERIRRRLTYPNPNSDEKFHASILRKRIIFASQLAPQDRPRNQDAESIIQSPLHPETRRNMHQPCSKMP